MVLDMSPKEVFLESQTFASEKTIVPQIVVKVMPTKMIKILH